MIVCRKLSEVPRHAYPVVTVGTFDGVHLGHRAILERLRVIAQANHGQVVVLTFHPHPRKVLGPAGTRLSMLNTLEERIRLFDSLGVDVLVVLEFTPAFSEIGYEAFVRDYLVGGLGIKMLVIGYDHQFGHRRQGGMQALSQLAPTLGFELEEIPEQDIDAIAVSSTRIRTALLNAEVELARNLLGYAYTLEGTVVQGRQIGRTIGFPTANLAIADPDKLIPANGVYAVWVECEGQRHKGAMSIGHRPTFDAGERSVEVYLLHFNGDLYGKSLRVECMHHLRPELKFDSVDDLVRQMQQDCLKADQLLAD